jgi:cyclic pyranopterin phosphate synthase
MTDIQLVDPFGRRIDYLRLSVTDRCDFRCIYCMPENMRFSARNELLSIEELHEVASTFIALGVRKIRITGGEPLVRKDLNRLLSKLAGHKELTDLAITTNGTQLVEQAVELHRLGVQRLNISLDSLSRERFALLTRRDRLEKVLDGITSAIGAGFKRVKINSVIQREVNFDEVYDLAIFALSRGLDISFIEEMPLGVVNSHDRNKTLVTSDEVLERLSDNLDLTPVVERTGGPSKYYSVRGYDGRIGFISPHSHNFCSACNRVRVTADGKLVLCLGENNAIDLKRILRESSYSRDAMKSKIVDAMKLKPVAHSFDRADEVQVIRFMSVTGG